MKKVYLGATLIMLLVLATAGCGSGQADLTQGKVPQEIVRSVINNSGKIDNYCFISYIHGTRETSIRGKVSTRLPAAEYYEFFDEKNPESFYTIYMRGSKIFIKTLNNKWQPVKENVTEGGSVEMYLKQVTSANPAAVLPEIFGQKTDIKRLKDEPIDGRNMAVIEVVCNFSRLASQQGKYKTDLGKSKDNVTVTLWVGKNDLLVYRYLVKGKLVNQGEEVPVSITTTMYDFNKTKITPPGDLAKYQEII